MRKEKPLGKASGKVERKEISKGGNTDAWRKGRRKVFKKGRKETLLESIQVKQKCRRKANL